MVEGEGFEPSKAKPSDLQSGPFDHSGTPPDFFLALYSLYALFFNPLVFLPTRRNARLRLSLCPNLLLRPLLAAMQQAKSEAQKPTSANSTNQRGGLFSLAATTYGVYIATRLCLYFPRFGRVLTPGSRPTFSWCRHKESNPGPSHYK